MNANGAVLVLALKRTLARLVMVGAVFGTALTVTVKLDCAVREPSETVRVMVATPDLPAAGETVTVRLAAVPASTMRVVGTSVVFEELAVTVRLVGSV